MAILILSQRQFVVDSCGIARIVSGNNRRTILPDIVSTIDGWKLDGIDNEEFLADNFGDDFDNSPTIAGLRSETRKERENNRGTTNREESERLANLERYAAQGFAFERPADSGDSFDDFDTRIQCEELSQYDHNGNEV